MSSTVRNVQIDVPGDRYDETVTFWAAALGATTRPGAGPYTHLVGPRSEVGVHLQRLEDGPARCHLDLESADPEAEVARLVDLGATPFGRGEDGEVLADPAGLLLCVVPAGMVVESLADRDAGHAYLDAVVLDVPPAVQQATADFWAAALGVAPFEPQRPGDPYLWSDGLRSTAGAFDLGVQRLGDDSSARIHLDTISDDVAGEVSRLTGLGATMVTELPRWTVLADPAGTLLCVVDSSGAPPDDASDV